MPSMSASMYGSPYTMREQLPRVKYPPFFSALNDITFKWFMDSKQLALAVVLLAVGLLVLAVTAIMPFWFELILNPIDGTFGAMSERTRTVINCGLFFLREDHFDNLASLDKFSNADVVPRVMALAQTLAVLGHCTLAGCLAGAVVLALRRFASPTGLIFLAAATSLAAIAEILVCICCLILVLQSSCSPDQSCYQDNLLWQMIPMYTQMYRVEPKLTPQVTANWAFYIAILGALLCAAVAVLLWLEAMSTSSTVGNIRYQQLSQTMDPHEGDIDPNSRQKFVYAAPDRYGPGVYGMQPVIGFEQPAPLAPQPQMLQPYAAPSYTHSTYSDTSYTHSQSSAPSKQREINL